MPRRQHWAQAAHRQNAYTPPKHLFMEFEEDKDKRTPAQRIATEASGMVPVNMETEQNLGITPTARSLAELTEGMSVPRTRRVYAAFGMEVPAGRLRRGQRVTRRP